MNSTKIQVSCYIHLRLSYILSQVISCFLYMISTYSYIYILSLFSNQCYQELVAILLLFVT